MKFLEIELPGVYIIEPDIFKDERGIFIKTFHEMAFKERGLECNFKESFYSISKKGVIRGMHFQIPPYDHAKLIYVTSGKIVDIILDIRKELPTYGKYVAIELSSENGRILYVPKGCAHGFLAFEDNSTVIYLQTTIHSAEHDKGIRWDSFGMDWGIENPIISKRDMGFSKFENFDSFFTR